MPLARLRMDELVNAWVGDANTPFQLGLLGVFDAGRWRRTDGSIAVEDLARELAARAGGCHRCGGVCYGPALGRVARFGWRTPGSRSQRTSGRAPCRLGTLC